MIVGRHGPDNKKQEELGENRIGDGRGNLGSSICSKLRVWVLTGKKVKVRGVLMDMDGKMLAKGVVFSEERCLTRKGRELTGVVLCGR